MFWESVRIAWLGLIAQKLRTALTMLGIIIGVAAVITLVSLGAGTQRQVEAQIQSLGSNLIMVNPVRSAGGRLDLRDVPELLATVPQIQRVVPTVNSNVTLKLETASHTTALEGVNAEFPAVKEFQIAQGRFLSADDVEQRRKVVVLGPTVADKLFGAAPALGSTVRIRGEGFQVIGITEKKGASLGGDNDDKVWIPVTAAQRLLGSTWIARFDLQVRSAAEAPAAVQLLTDFYRLQHRREDTVRIQSMDQILEAVGNITAIMTAALGAIAGISLLVGGIGIMNIMLVSVSERTREIGIRKAVGAKRRDVLMQFLVEALVLSLSGGIIGIGIGAGGAWAISLTGVVQAATSTGAILLAFGFSAAVGTFFGIYPAVRAANLDPIEALRRE